MNHCLIKLTDVSCLTRENQAILNKINLEIYSGDILSIIGPNGGGKTTLLRVILGLSNPSSGDIQIDPSVKYGYMPQKLLYNKLLPIKVKDFLSLGHEEKGRVSSVAAKQKIEHLLPKQLNSLSGGETQKVLFSKVLLTDANALILDEPIQGLDVNGQEEFYNDLTVLSKEQQKTIIMVSHDLHTVMRSTNKVICLNKHICCNGLPSEIVKHQKYIDIFGRAHTNLLHYRHEHDHKH